ncbi:polymeric immunoglobulin receptor-like [Acanthopagrus latus]|uniref:polymeric immunoglobulin receptor-like n=1 Tax=Acanthopagrus latus TaxID=8177 RepID=UPI00187CEB6D|nr:polymeric immunoglobulin receptor-like [Acanthopagrus latus]
MRMWSLQSLLFTLCVALSCVTRAAGLIHVYGYEGREVDVPCPYEEGYDSYVKYLCKNDCAYEDVVVKTEGAWESKYSIRDDKTSRVFTVTISKLSRADAGKYWCVVERSGKDIYSEVRLEVEQDTCCDQSITLQTHEGATASFDCPYAPADQNNLKYVCRGNLSSTCLQQALINSTSQQSGRFRLQDDTRVKTFKVTIISLIQADSGRYLCGVHRDTGLDVFTAVDLQVKEWCCVKSEKLSGTVGSQVTVRCPYPPQHKDYRKFLCKGDHRKDCTDMTSQSRFMPQDQLTSSVFSVTIKALKTGDAGTYWCVSDPLWRPANYTKIQLSVDSHVPGSTMIPHTTVEEPVRSQASVGIPGTPAIDAKKTHLVVFIVPAVVLVLMLAVLVLVWKFKCHKVQEAEVADSGNKTKAARAEKVIQAEDIYANQDVVCMNQGNSYDHYDDAGDESVYQNTADDVYCNQFPMKARSRIKMWSPQNLLFILCIPLSCVTHAAKTIDVSGYEGTTVTVSCPYDRGYMSNRKYLCRNDCGSDSDVLISTTEAKRNKYSIRDDKEKQVFTVTIPDLRRTDAGKYWCGVSKFGFDDYPSEVKVKVEPKWCCVKANKLSGIVGRPLTLQCPYPPQHRSHRKFLCRGAHYSNCTDMATSQSRFSVQDHLSSSSFMVTITELEAGDVGTYWCGSDPLWRPDNYTKIQLSVVFPQQSSTVTPHITVGFQSTLVPGDRIKDVTSMHAVVLGVPAVVLLILALALVMVYKCKAGGPGVNVNRKITMDTTTIYELDDAAVYSNMGPSKQVEDQQESVYQNITLTEGIYCNEF